MDSKERVTRAFSLEMPDKVPIGFYAIDCDTVRNIIGRDTFIRNKPGIKLALWQGRRDEVAESLKQDCLDLFCKLDCLDIITFKEAQVLPPRDYAAEMPKKIDDDTYEDAQGRIWQLAWDANDVCVVHDPNPVQDTFTPDMFPMPKKEDYHVPDDSCFEVFDFMVEHFKDSRYILSGSGGLGCMPLLGGMENGLMQYALAPEAVDAAARQRAAFAGIADQYEIRSDCDGVLIEQDMAGTNGLMISPVQWREICKPRLAQRVASVKQYKLQVVLHCCGKTHDILDDIAECGVSCYQSLQTNAGMTPDVLCRDFGEKMAFWGGVPVELLLQGTPDEMKREVIKVLDETKGCPGFILGPSHSIAYGTKYDNFMGMLETWDKYGVR